MKKGRPTIITEQEA